MGDCNKKSPRNEFLSVRLHDRNDFFVFLEGIFHIPGRGMWRATSDAPGCIPTFYALSVVSEADRKSENTGEGGVCFIDSLGAVLEQFFFGLFSV